MPVYPPAKISDPRAHLYAQPLGVHRMYTHLFAQRCKAMAAFYACQNIFTQATGQSHTYQTGINFESNITEALSHFLVICLQLIAHQIMRKTTKRFPGEFMKFPIESVRVFNWTQGLIEQALLEKSWQNDEEREPKS